MIMRTAISKNLGDVLVLTLKAVLPAFVFFGHKNYRIEIARFLLNIQAIWPAFWAKIAEDHMVIDGLRRGHAKPNDHCCEIFVGLLKRALKASRISMTTVLRYSKNSVFMLRLLEGFRKILRLGQRAGTHTRSWPRQELKWLEDHLLAKKIFVYTPGRKCREGCVDDVPEKSSMKAHEFLSRFLNNSLEPVLDADVEKLPDDHQLDDDDIFAGDE